MTILVDYFAEHYKQGHSPLLLEYPGVSICATKPLITLEVIDGRLYKNKKLVGEALDLFDHLQTPHDSTKPTFFPAWLGFFSYSFARYFGFAAHKNRHFPDAFFQYFTEGLSIKTEEHDLPSVALHQQVRHSFRPDVEHSDFIKAAANTKESIRNGDVYQANLTLPFTIDPDLHPIELYRRMREMNKSSYMGIVAHEDWWLLSGSPERLFLLQDSTITARPIAGTKKRGTTVLEDNALIEELKNCPKENAEHAMLVDLMRNDLNQVCHPGTVQVTEDRTIEFYSHVMHLVSEVKGKSNKPLLDIMRALFPGGTITGAPKKASMETIAQFELTPREAYTGSLGYISNAGLDFNILIRSYFKKGDRGFTQAGAGIVIDSVEENEWREVNKKAQFLSAVLRGETKLAHRREPIMGVPLVIQGKSDRQEAHVLFLENNDSFSFNIVDALHTLNAKVRVVSKDFSDDIQDYTHLVIGPGPGSPATNPQIERMLRCATYGTPIPILGICLGHQALAEFFGATIKRAARPIHGERWNVVHHGQGLFQGLPSPSLFARYHSLAVEQAPENFVVDAFTKDDCIMAIRHKTKPFFGIQFHPESYLSKDGHFLLDNFLKTSSSNG